MAYTDQQFQAGMAETASNEEITNALVQAMDRRTLIVQQFLQRLRTEAERSCGNNAVYYQLGYLEQIITNLAITVPGVAERLDHSCKKS